MTDDERYAMNRALHLRQFGHDVACDADTCPTCAAFYRADQERARADRLAGALEADAALADAVAHVIDQRMTGDYFARRLAVGVPLALWRRLCDALTACRQARAALAAPARGEDA